MADLRLSEDELRRIEPSNLELVLGRLGAYQSGGVRDVSRQWIINRDTVRASVLVPLDPTYEDFTLRLSEAIQRIAEFYPSPLESLVLDLSMPGVDEITNRKDESTIHGSIPWSSAERQIVGFRETLVAAAKATEERQRYFGKSHRKIAQEYLAQLRMGQTKVGSFVITALSPIGPLLIADRGATYKDTFGGATGRKVAETVAEGLSTLRIAADEYLQSGRAEVFSEAVESGVSLDLARGMRKNLGDAQGAETSISWSPRLLSQFESQVTKIDFQAKHIAALKTAVERLEKSDARRAVTILGIVTQLDRPTPGEMGKITVQVIDGSDAATVHVALDDLYDDAIDYHRSGNIIRLVGFQELEKSQYWIRDITDIRLINTQDELPRSLNPSEPS